MTFPHAILLFVAAVLAGTMNSVAGGGSFFSFPALIFTGVLPIPANATNTVAVWPGSVASVFSYWKRLPRSARVMAPLIIISIVGGVVGAVVLLHTPQATFMTLVPYLFGLATLLFAFGKRLTRKLGQVFKRSGPPSWPIIVGLTGVQFFIALYGGFFGGGMGILMLAMLEMMHIDDIHTMNGLKAILGTAINGAAVVTFIAARQVVWPQGILMIVGAVAGGYGGAHYAQKIDPRWVRASVICVGTGMTLYFLWRY
ncbi:MAG: sulfite exporter TauE/SafE family protein [Acidobacteriota bacterium]|nr:sulfite exporter TauE/SafE family protein [Acidobacteriota bacterium]